MLTQPQKKLTYKSKNYPYLYTVILANIIWDFQHKKKMLTSSSSLSKIGRAGDSMKSILCSTPAFLMTGKPTS